VLRLYPLPEPTKINLNYFCGLWLRLQVAAKLSISCSDFATKEIFLRHTEAQRTEFQPQYHRMRERLNTRIFTLIHSFETYRDLHVQHLMSGGTPLCLQPFTVNPIEARILSAYDNETLLAAHEIFPLLMSCFSRRLRPPSYAGRAELKGYLRDRPADEVYATIMLIGGLRQVQRFWVVKGYNTRRSAVNIWYETVSRAPPTLPTSKLSFTKRLRPKKLLSDPEKRSHGAGGCGEWYCVNATCRANQRLQSTPGLVKCSLTAGPPMAPLTRDRLLLLLPDLPQLKDIWIYTAEALIIERKLVEKPQDLKRTHQVLLVLIRDGGSNRVSSGAVQHSTRPVSFRDQENVDSAAVENRIQGPEGTGLVESDCFNLPTASTAQQPISPRPSLESISESIAAIFWASDDLKGLFRETLVTSRKITLDWCQESFRMSWIRACQRLSDTVSDSLTKGKARALREMSKLVAHAVRVKAVPLKGVELHPEVSAEESTNFNGDTTQNPFNSTTIDDKTRQPNFGHQDSQIDDQLPEDLAPLLPFLKTSGLFQTILDTFRLSIHNDPVEEAILEVWPISCPRSSSTAVKFEIKWELPTYLQTYFSQIQQLGDVLTITGDYGTAGDAFNAQATPCRDYLSATWPAIAIGLLEGVGSMLHTSQAGKLTSLHK
jgi:hypothetical protein